MERRKFIYAGLVAVIIVAGGLAAFFATRPPERVVETVVQTVRETVEKPVERVITKTIEKPIERTVVTTVAGTPTTIVKTEVVKETVKETITLTTPVVKTEVKTITITPPAPKKLTILGPSDPLRVKWVEKAISKFRELHPDVEVEYIKAVKFEIEFTTSMGAGRGPDVIYVDGPWIPFYVEAGYLLDITKYVEAWPDWEFYTKGMKEYVTYKGKVYAICWDSDVRVVWYRKDIFGRAGIPLPWKPETVKDLIDTAVKIKEKLGIYPLTFPVPAPLETFYLFLWGMGGELYDPATDQWIGKSPEFLEALKIYRDLYFTYKVVDPELAITAKPWDYMREAFSGSADDVIARKGAAIMLSGSWEWGESFAKGRPYEVLPSREEVVGYVPFPAKPGAPITGSGGITWAITSQADDPDLAWEFMKIVNSKEIVAGYNAESAHITPRIDVWEVPIYAKEKILVDLGKFMVFTRMRPVHPDFPTVNRLVERMIVQVSTGELTPEEALNRYAETLITLFGADRVKIIG
jgi:multiple sugar transport system substrate-binding protein